MICRVLRIEEDMDFGCEERLEGMPVMAVLVLSCASGEELRIRYPDAELYRLKIKEGDRILWDPAAGKIQKQAEKPENE